jgi:hypothetical protein
MYDTSWYCKCRGAQCHYVVTMESLGRKGEKEGTFAAMRTYSILFLFPFFFFFNAVFGCQNSFRVYAVIDTFGSEAALVYVRIYDLQLQRD